MLAVPSYQHGTPVNKAVSSLFSAAAGIKGGNACSEVLNALPRQYSIFPGGPALPLLTPAPRGLLTWTSQPLGTSAMSQPVIQQGICRHHPLLQFR